jgi:group I intron endonuclease
MNNVPKGMCGLYEIACSANGRRYIGSSMRCRIRVGNHFGAMARNTHYNRHLQAAWNKYGMESFSARPLLVCAQKDLIFYEQMAVDVLKPEFNLALSVDAPFRGRKMPIEQRQYLASLTSQLIGRHRPEELKARISEGLRKYHAELKEAGIAHPGALKRIKLDADTRKAIVNEHAAGGITHQALADKYAVSKTMITNILLSSPNYRPRRRRSREQMLSAG